MKKYITDEKTGISYTLIGDYYIPDLVSPDTGHIIGQFGRLHQKYLREHRRLVYNRLLTSGSLNAYLHDIDVQAGEMFDRLMPEYAERQGVTERLKAENQMEWVGRMNHIRNAVEEVIFNDLIFR